ncbi:hypothetical protein ACOSQ4_027099 [Xanthoceras sorbifolium]
MHSSMDTTPPIRKPSWKRRARTSNDSRSVLFGGVIDSSLRVVGQTQKIVVRLSSGPGLHLRREIGRTRGRIRTLGLQVTASSWRELRVQERKLDALLRQDEEF